MYSVDAVAHMMATVGPPPMDPAEQFCVVKDPDRTPKPNPDWTRFVCYSDTHGAERNLPNRQPKADVVLHAGDFTDVGALDQVEDFAQWCAGHPGITGPPEKVVIAGNHDLSFDPGFYLNPHKDPAGQGRPPWVWRRHPQPHAYEEVRGALEKCGVRYLEDEVQEVCGYRIYGSPWQPEFGLWAFNAKRGPEIRAKWEAIPSDIDILMTHGPPRSFGGLCLGLDRNGRVDAHEEGCADLLDVIQDRSFPIHVSGHIHEGYGVRNDKLTTYINASSLDVGYNAGNHPPIVFDLPPPAEFRARHTEMVARYPRHERLVAYALGEARGR